MLSPDGRVVLIDQGQTIGCVSATSEPAPRWCTAPLLRLRGNNGRPVFSPDGRKIAFVSDRKDHSFIGVLDTGSNEVTWLAPDANRDDFPAWSPDGTQVAFIRIGGARFGELLDITGAWPFEIWIADAGDGTGQRVYRARSPATGGFAWADGQREVRRASRAGDGAPRTRCCSIRRIRAGFTSMRCLPGRGPAVGSHAGPLRGRGGDALAARTGAR